MENRKMETRKGRALWRPELSASFRRRNWRLTSCGGHWSVDRREPVVLVGFGAAGDREKFFLQFSRDRAGDAFADLNVIYRADRRNFYGGANEENFVNDVQHFAWDNAFFHGDAHILRHFYDGIAGDAGKNAGGERRRVEDIVVHQEDVHAGAFAEVALFIERDAFRVAVKSGFHSNQLRVHVVGSGFGQSRQGVRRHARPGTDADVNALGERIRSKIGAPSPAGHVAFDGRVERIDADFAVTTQHDRLDVAGVEFVVAHQFAGGVAEILDGKGKLHAINFRGIDEPLHVLAQTENRWALLGVVATDTF